MVKQSGGSQNLEMWSGGFDFALELSKQKQRDRALFRNMLLSFIEVADSFDRYFALLSRKGSDQPHDESLRTVYLIAKQLEAALRQAGVAPIQCLGQQAVPGSHEILEVQDVPGAVEDEIVGELLRGYEWDGEILRKPGVIAARGKRVAEAAHNEEE